MTHLYSDLASFRRDPLSFLVQQVDKATEPLVPLAFGPDPVYLLTDPDYIKPLLKTSEEVVDKGPMIKKFRELTGDNTVVLSGPEHRRRRAVLQSIVGRQTVEPLTPVLASEVRKAIADLAQTPRFDARQFGARIAMRLICVVLFGANVLSREDEELLLKTLDSVLSDLTDVVFADETASSTQAERNERLTQGKRQLHEIVQHLRERAPGSVIDRSLCELDLSESDTADELLLLLIAGHDTTGSAASWLSHTLATVPGLADAIAAEAVTVRDQTGEIDFAKLASAKSTLALVQEILRLYPSTYWTARGTQQEIQFAGRNVPAGASIIVSPWLFHRSARFWDAPNEFRLDRDYLKTNAYIPFGTGPRICVGFSLALLELQIIALEMASAFELIPAGPVGAPRPLIHLWPPCIPLEARPRITPPTNVSESVETAETPASSAGFRTGCPYAHKTLTTELV